MSTVRHPLRFAAAVFFFCAGVFLFPACSHYQLGSGGKLAFRTLYIEPVGNTADIPQAVALFSTQLRDAFIRNGRVTLVNSPDQADAVLSVNLTNYARAVATSRRDDTGLARQFDLTVTALCTLTDNRAGKAFFTKRPVNATREIFTTPTSTSTQSNQLQAEYNTMPLLAGDLADSVAHTVLDVW